MKCTRPSKMNWKEFENFKFQNSISVVNEFSFCMDSISAEMSSDHDATENGSDIEWQASSEMEISEDAWSLNSSDVVVDSEPESVNSSRKKRRKLERVIPPPTRPDNEMTRKLRPQKLPLSETTPPPVKPSTPSPPASPLLGTPPHS